MYLLLVIAVWILFAYKFVDWSQWKKQYSTILFFMVVNLLYNTIYYNHTLWAFRGITVDWLNHSIINFAFTFFICPVGLIIYLQRFPSTNRNQLLYVGIWVTFYTIIEALFAHRGMFVYDHGWNSWHNIWLNLILFVLLRIHYKNPVTAWLISVPLAIIFYFIFPVPLESLK
jgi:hypothetical protein